MTERKETDDYSKELKFDIIRETGDYSKENIWLNRFCRVADSDVNPSLPRTPNYLTMQEIRYYCETAIDHELIFHRGEKTGPVIATAIPCLQKEGGTDIHFMNPKLVIPLQHIHHILQFTHDKNNFEHKDKKYHWKDHTELVDDEAKVVLAKFRPSWLEGQGHKIGQLVITPDGQEMMDVAVVTALVVQERADEYQLSVFCPPWIWFQFG